MRKLFSTDQAADRDPLRQWQEYCEETYLPLRHRKIGQNTVSVSVHGTSAGGLNIHRGRHANLELEANTDTIRRTRRMEDILVYDIKFSGEVFISQDGRTARQSTGDASLYSSTSPITLSHVGDVEHLTVFIERRRLEKLIGSARNYTALTMHAHLPTASLVRTFFTELIRVKDGMTPSTVERMASVGVDLIAAGIAERMALDAPKSLHGTLIVQRAKAHIEANLGDVRLDPAQVAAATGVSLRYLQGLFAEHGRSVAGWIWRRRLDTAAGRLSDPGFAHLPVGAVAYGCGFTNQSHFARRFREQFDLSPGDYRRRALLSAHAGPA